jgi:hypothetical protein
LHNGMKKVFYKLGENFQLFCVDENECRCLALPDSDNRRIHLCVDKLSSRNFRCLKINLSKKLTELGTAKFVLPLLESLCQFTCTIDYLHETQMHRNDAIYRTPYSGFLQAFQCHLTQKGITGDPVKKMQHHEKFIHIVDRAHRRVRMKRYLAEHVSRDFSRLEGETQSDFILRQDNLYLVWCDDWNEGLDEPTIASNLFMKYIDSYRRCHYGVKRGNTWLMDIEGCHWMCGWKLVRKSNYTQETCYRIDTLFGGEQLTPEDLEWR